jgi:predicted FMN-binding regulatory protein PaiB
MEAAITNAWKITEISRSEITRWLPSTQGFQLEVERIEGKLKVGQDEPKRDALAVSGHLARSLDPSHRAPAEITRLYDEDRPDGMK